MSKNEKWEQVETIDLSRRKAQDWAKIYLVELLEEPSDDRLWSEYEWAYFFFNAKYKPDFKNFKNHEDDLEKFSEMELRAMEIRRDIFLGASIGEREILNERYVETEWIRYKIGGM